MIISYFIINFFVQMHADTADGILVAFLQQEEMNRRKMLETNPAMNKGDFGRNQFRETKHQKTKDIVK